MRDNYRIRNFPISFFSIILGLSGFAIAFQKAEQILQIPFAISDYILYIALFVFSIITMIYLLKIILAPRDVMAEFRHSNKLNFFPAFSISLLLFSIAFLDINLTVTRYLWISGVALHLLFTIKTMSFWIQHDGLEASDMNPAWFIPIVGNILVPVAGVAVYPAEISWFFFSIGLLFWIVLFTILINRLLFHKPMHEKLLPTLFIMIAPPAVGFISYVKLTGAVNDFSRILFYFALFILLLLIAQIKYLYRSRFFLSWWAYSFPLSAITIATSLMFHKTEMIFFRGLAYFLLSILCIVIIGLIFKTIVAITKRQICVEE